MSGMRLELTWPHKDEFLLVPKDEDGKPVWVERSHPAAHEVRLTREAGAVGTFDGTDPHLDNTIFVGDSLDAMRVMCEVPEYAERYRGKVKLIYADPPFNTQQTFEHYDDWMEHATWLSFMRDRLILMRDLLSPEGSVWIHLDDAEQHRMRSLLDEVFGAQNHVATVVWQKVYVGDNRSLFATAHDYIIIFAKSKTDWNRNLLNRSDEQLTAYKNPDNDPRGLWRMADTTAQAAPGRRASQFYDLELPDGRTIKPPEGRCWLLTRERFDEFTADNRIYFVDGGRPYIKKFLSEVQSGIVPMTWWPHDDVGHNKEAKLEIKALFPGRTPFDTPKPERLLERIIHIGSNPGDIIFDPFAGSGTTAAVAQKMGRRWGTSELNLENVDRFIAPRLAKVTQGEDPGGITSTVEWKGGGGFRTVVIEPSLYEVGFDDMVFLRDDVDPADLARAMAGQMRFTYMTDNEPFCGRRGRMLLAVFPGVIGVEEMDELVSKLPDDTRVTVAAGALIPGAADHLAKISRGSKALKIPRDVLTRTLRAARDCEPEAATE